MTTDEIREGCLTGKITQKKLKELGYTKVYGLKIPLELETDEELSDGLKYCRYCAEEEAFYDNERKSDLFYESCDKIKAEIEKRKRGMAK